jgi:Protein of unknown function (DUF3046)
VREAELWRRLESTLGKVYAQAWAGQVVLSEIGGRTVIEALAAGVDRKHIWRAVWGKLELPVRDR